MALHDALAALDEHGVLPPLADLIREVYRRAADRHEPDLGDDAMSFGTMVWRNLTNLGRDRFADLPGVDARIEDNSLEIRCAGYVLRLYALQGSVESIRWEGSDVRLEGAVANSCVEQLALDDEGQFRHAFADVVPRRRHVRVAHTGDLDTGDAIAYIGLPRDNRDGGSPWFEVTLWFGEPAARTPVLGSAGAGLPHHDQLPIPELDVRPAAAATTAT